MDVLSRCLSFPLCTLVVPCYNEALRLNRAAFEEFFREHPQIHWIFVNDGSKDDTLSILQSISSRFPDQVQVIDQQPNAGKAEAVRNGLLKASNQARSPLIGFWDADLATPLSTIPAFIEVLDSRPSIQMVFGARVKLLGREVHRKAIRHYLGRIFATTVSMLLQLPIYDTQCGAKILRATPALNAVLVQPFISRWVFDVEILARLLRNSGFQTASLENSIYELPLPFWKDVGGSKVKPGDFLKAFFDVYAIWWHYLRH